MAGDATEPFQEKTEGLRRSLGTHVKIQTWVISVVGFTIVVLTALETLVSVLRH